MQLYKVLKVPGFLLICHLPVLYDNYIWFCKTTVKSEHFNYVSYGVICEYPLSYSLYPKEVMVMLLSREQDKICDKPFF